MNKRILPVLVAALMTVAMVIVALPSTANAAPAPVTGTTGAFAPIGTPISLSTPSLGTANVTVQRVDTGAVAPVGATVPGTNGLVVGPNNSVVTKAQLTAMRHGKRVTVLAGAYLYQTQVQGEMCGSPLGCYWDWYQWLGPVDYWGYGAEIWHGWVDGTYWGNDNLDNCQDDGGILWTPSVGYCSWQGANPTSGDMDIALLFHTTYFKITATASYWMHIEIGDLGWSLTVG